MEKRAHTGEQRAHEDSTGYHVGKTPSHVGKTPSHVGKTPSHVGKTPSHVGKTPSHVGRHTASHVGEMGAGGRIQADEAKNNFYDDISRKFIISSSKAESNIQSESKSDLKLKSKP